MPSIMLGLLHIAINVVTIGTMSKTIIGFFRMLKI